MSLQYCQTKLVFSSPELEMRASLSRAMAQRRWPLSESLVSVIDNFPVRFLSAFSVGHFVGRKFSQVSANDKSAFASSLANPVQWSSPWSSFINDGTPLKHFIYSYRNAMLPYKIQNSEQSSSTIQHLKYWWIRVHEPGLCVPKLCNDLRIWLQKENINKP